MKKFLSIILVAALLVSIVPSVFAAVDEETGLNTQTYNFNYDTLDVTADEKTALGDDTLTIVWIQTNRTWVVGTDDAPTDLWAVKNISGFNSTQATKNEFKLVGTKKKGNSYVLLSLNIDEAGVYLPTISQNIPTENRRGKYNVYFFSAADLEDKGLTAESPCADIANVMTPANGESPIDVKTSPEKSEIQFGEYVVSEKSDDIAQYVLLEIYESPSSTGKLDDQVWIKSLCFKQIGKIEAEPETPSGGIVYGFNAESTENGSEGGKGVAITKEPYTKSVNGGYWEYVEVNNFKSPSIYGTFLKCTVKDGLVVSESTPAYLTLKITVDKAGTYRPSIECENRSRGGHLKTYLVSEDAYKGFLDIYNTKKPLDDKYIETYTAGDAGYEVYSFENVTLNAGTYYLTFVVDGAHKSITAEAQEHIRNFTLTPVEDAPSGNITYCVASNLSDNLQIKTTVRGNKISLSAEEKEGYTFRAWVRGSADNGTWVSAEPEYSFIAMTNTMLTAVYTENPAEDEKVVEYYNENGEYIATKDVKEESPTPTKLVGYEFDDWYVSDGVKLALDSITDSLTRAVAKHNVEANEYTVSYNGNKTYKYDESVTLTSPDAVCWLRDGKPVDYGTTYTFYVWDDTTITTESGDNSPKVMLDIPKGNSRMIEYDEGNGDIVEAGIIFGDNSAITVDSCSKKMISQRLGAHGQFTATSEYSVARGYIIYENINGGLEIVYAD